LNESCCIAVLPFGSFILKNGPYDDLEDEYRDTLSWLFNAAFGRIAATAQEIGKQIFNLGTLKHLLGK
jgi:hypothetical protein